MDPLRLIDAVAAHGLLVAALLGLGLLAPVIRIAATRRALRSRVRVVLVPSDEFDPSLESIQRFAAHLARASRGRLGWLDRPGRSIGIRIDLDQESRLRLRVEAPRRSLPAVRAAASAYADVAVLPDDDATPPARSAAGDRPRIMRCELVLARASQHPLRDLGLDPDPMQALASAMSTVRGERGESACIALNLLPTTPAGRRRARRRLLRPVGHGDLRDALLTQLGPPRRVGSGRRSAGELVQRRSDTRALQDKLGGTDALMGMQLLLHVQASSTSRARDCMNGLLACVDAQAGENDLRVAGLRLAGPWFAGSDLPVHRGRFDRRMASGRFAPASQGLVTVREIAWLLKPPTRHCHAENVLRSGGIIAPAPRQLPIFDGQPDLIPLGRATVDGEERVVGVRVAQTVFSYMAGRSRYGKTETAIGQFVHLARSGHGGLFLDPHADAIREIKTYLTDPALRDRVVEIDLSDLADAHGQPGWNLFDVHGRPPWEAAQRVEAVVDALAAALGWDERNTRALNLATQAAHALTQLAATLPPALAPTVFQISPLLSSEAWRAAVLPHVGAATRAFFTDRFPRLSPEAITPVTNVVDRLHAARPVAALLGNPVSSLDVRRAMDDGLIILACPGPGSSLDRLVANFLVYEVLHAAKGRAQHPAADRRTFWLFLDELQTYDGPNLPPLLEQSAKYGVRAFLFNQNPERLATDTLSAVTTNRSHLATAAVNAKAAALLTREWGGEPTPQTITQLARYTYLASVTLGDRTSRPFLVNGIRAADLHADARRPADVPTLNDAIDRTTHRRGVQATIDALDHHDQRILDHLATRRRQAMPSSPDARVPPPVADPPIALPELPEARESR